jgi:nitroimidazol reductase NimA-like FMN-containing flavoprotein (pyridoxamine 5'-phosphate oxidase superfamily)
MFGKLTDEQIEQLLHQQIVGRIGCHYDGLTYVLPISYAYDGDYIYCLTKEGMKTKLMRQNSRVCFQVDDMQNMANWKSVIAWGDFEELPVGAVRRDAVQHLIKRALPIVSSETTHIGPHWPFLPENLDDIKGIVFRIKLEAKTGRFEKSDPVVDAVSR